MATRQHVIELNGQKYDAFTGTLLGAAAAAPHKTVSAKSHAAKHAPAASKHLDGFTRRAGPSKPVANQVHSHPERSKTLMRTGLKKPVSAKIHAKAPATSPSATGRKAVHTNSLVEAVRPGRAIRAQHVSKSNLISKFGGSSGAAITTEMIPVKPAPSAAPQRHVAAHATPPIVNHPAQKAIQADPFQSALENAISHKQPKAKKTKMHHKVARKLNVSPRIVSFASFSLITMAITGFVAYQNMPEIAMRIAAARAGFHANLPSYQPSGFALAGPIKYEPGEVTVNYKSNSDDRGFNVVQRNSSWNSETLLENYVTTNSKPYQTFQANGRTIYIYDGNKATWVDGGVWYSIDGKANLNSDQLLRIAGSL